ncbi:unnamed protein product [Calicophoron daubneyi]|uniref:DNA polymerase kappa n=1 Tax=Calicophoron daubneyi TaxID=300641 RepID=A0AAV2SWX2_CALDB
MPKVAGTIDQEPTECCRYSTNKAGMEGLDKATITHIIVENSKGSKFYENELRRERVLQQQIDQKLAQIRALTPAMLQHGELEADSLIKEIQERRCFSRCIVHVDMDAFFAAVEIRDQPELRFHPVAVGSNSMLSTSNYIARRFGVRAGMPGFMGKKLCPQLRIVPPDFGRYRVASHAARKILRNYCRIGASEDVDSAKGDESNAENVDESAYAMVAASLDEAYLDLTQHLRDRETWPEERRSYWPRPNPGAKMLVCRCSQRKKKTKRRKPPQPAWAEKNVPESEINSDTPLVPADEHFSSPPSHDIRSSEDEVEESLVEHHPAPTTDSPDKSHQRRPDPELDVCQNCGLLIKSGLRVFGTTAWDAVREIRFRVFCATQLTCSAGLGPNTMLAKIASDWVKPCGQFEIERSQEAVDNFIYDLPVRKVPGIGHVTERRLEAFGVHTCHDLIEKRGLLWHVNSRLAMGSFLKTALGHREDDWLPCSDPTLPLPPPIPSDTPQVPGQFEIDRKSMSVERTFPDCSDPDELAQRCRQLASMLSSDLKKKHLKARALTMKLKLDTFEIRSRSQFLPDYTNEAEILAALAIRLIREEIANEKLIASTAPHPASTSRQQPKVHSGVLTLRLMGLRASTLLPEEMCPQIRQRSMEDALKQIVCTQGLSSPSNSPGRSMVPNPELPEGDRKESKCITNEPKMVKNKPGPLKKGLTTSSGTLTSISAWTQSSSSNESVKPVQKASGENDDPTNDSSSSITVTCPVCSKQLKFLSEQQFNHHLDDCLSRPLITEAVRESLSTPASTSHPPQSSSKETKKRHTRPTPVEMLTSGSLSKKTRNSLGPKVTAAQRTLDKFIL